MSQKTTYFGRLMAIFALVFALLFTTCDLESGPGPEDPDNPDNTPVRVADIVDALEPIITGQPAVGVALKTTDTAPTALSVTAVSQDGGVLSYQWYSFTEPAAYEAGTGTAVGGATAATFAPPVADEGVFYYYVVVTNTLAETTGKKDAAAKSEPSIVTVNDPNNAEYPAITALSGGGYYIAGAGLSVTVGVTAAVTDSGALTYKWYSHTSTATTGGTEIAGATGATYQLPSAAAGTYYYYVEITNTNNAKEGRKASTVTGAFAVTVVTTNAVVTVNTATEYQYVRGFGGMYTPWDNAPQESVEDFERMFSPSGLGLNMLRIMIKPDNTDIEKTMNDMINGLDGDTKDQSMYYEIVKIANKYGGYVLASPWSPPAAWKTNDSINGGGELRTGNYKNYANYLKKFCQIMYDNGAPIYAVSIQNEPTFKATYAGCEWTTIQHRDWWQQAGGTNGVPFTAGVKGWGGGKETERVLTMTGEAHNNVTPFHTHGTSALQTADARQYIDIVAVHNYGRSVNRIPDAQMWGKELWMTEYNINTEGNPAIDSTWPYVWIFMNNLDLSIRHNQENAYIWWTAKRFYSFIGDGWSGNGTTEGDILPRGYGISHYAKFAKEMTRVDVTATGSLGGESAGIPISTANVNAAYSATGVDVKITAYKSADGKTISMVMFTPTDNTGNSGSDMGTFKVQLPAGFTIARATAMRTTAEAKAVTESVMICNDRNSAIIKLPRSNILSVRFVGE